MKALQRLRISGILEGASYLILLGIAMPLKYIFDQPLAVKYVGWAHGILFMVFLALALQVALKRDWPFRRLIEAFFAALLPFGPFVWDKKVLKPEMEAMRSEQ